MVKSEVMGDGRVELEVCLRREEIERDVLLGQGFRGWNADVEVVLAWWELEGWVGDYLQV